MTQPDPQVAEVRYTIGCPIHRGTTHEGCALCRPMTQPDPQGARGRTHTGRDGDVEVDVVAWEDGTFTVAEVRQPDPQGARR